MDFFPLEYPEQDAVDGLNDALDSIGQSITPILTDIGSGLFEKEEQIEAAILALFRKTKSCLTRCITPFETQLEPVIQGLLQELNGQLDNLQQQALQVQGSLQQQKLTGGMQNLGTWWFLVGSPLPGKVAFNPGSPLPPTQDANWRGPYGSAQAAQQAYDKTGGSVSVPQIPSQEWQYTSSPTATQTPTVAPALTGNPPAPVSPQIPPPSLPVRKPVVIPPQPQAPQTQPGTTQTQQQQTGGSVQAVTQYVESPLQTETESQLPPENPMPVPATSRIGRKSGVTPYCGFDPQLIDKVVGHANIPVSWYPLEMTDIYSECGELQCEAARGAMVPVDLALRAIRAGDASAAWGEAESVKQEPGTINLP